MDNQAIFSESKDSRSTQEEIFWAAGHLFINLDFHLN